MIQSPDFKNLAFQTNPIILLCMNWIFSSRKRHLCAFYFCTLSWLFCLCQCSSTKKEIKKHPAYVGIIILVNPESKHVLIQTDSNQSFLPGTAVKTQDKLGKEITLTISPERKGLYLTADYKECNPALKAIVYTAVDSPQSPPSTLTPILETPAPSSLASLPPTTPTAENPTQNSIKAETAFSSTTTLDAKTLENFAKLDQSSDLSSTPLPTTPSSPNPNLNPQSTEVTLEPEIKNN
jgi:hypothetical protein